VNKNRVAHAQGVAQASTDGFGERGVGLYGFSTKPVDNSVGDLGVPAAKAGGCWPAVKLPFFSPQHLNAE
jgi:hypothetical protein